MEPFVAVGEIIINMYRQTSVPSRFAYTFWSMFIVIYLYTSLYERLHGLNLRRERKYKRWNHPITLYLLGITTVAVYHLTLRSAAAVHLPGRGDIWGTCGFVIMAVGLVLVCWGRASIDGYWGPNIYDYGAKNRLVATGAYKFTRHPIYDGQFLMSVGTVLMSDNLWIAFFPIILLSANVWRALREAARQIVAAGEPR